MGRQSVRALQGPQALALRKQAVEKKSLVKVQFLMSRLNSCVSDKQSYMAHRGMPTSIRHPDVVHWFHQGVLKEDRTNGKDRGGA